MQNPFRKRAALAHQTVGEILAAARAEKDVSLDEAARATKVMSAFLLALEKGKYSDLPSPVYIRNYLQVYAKFLGVPWEFIAEQYEKEIMIYRDSPKAQHEKNQQSLLKTKAEPKDATARKIAVLRSYEQRHAIIIPQLVKFGLFGLLVLVFALYVTIQLVRLYNPPELVVAEPASDYQTTTEKITIAGTTSPEASVEINGQRQDVNSDGAFRAELFVKDGVNTIRVTAQFKRSRKREVIRHVLFDAPDVVPTPVVE